MQNSEQIYKARNAEIRLKSLGNNAHLNSSNPDKWQRLLLNTVPFSGGVGIRHRDFVSFVCVLASNWSLSIPQMLQRLRSIGVTQEKFFELERNVTFKLSATLANINAIHNTVFQNNIDISPFIVNVSNAFLPRLVYELEEYGLPRMLSKKIQASGLIDLENKETTIHDVIEQFNQIGSDKLKQEISNLHLFETNFIIDYFYEGII